MKKVFLSAVFLFAVASSNANTIVEKINKTVEGENVVIAESTPQITKEVKYDLCFEWASGRLTIEDPNDELDNVAAHDRYHMWYDLCMAITSFTW
jgi:hypothetical protein